MELSLITKDFNGKTFVVGNQTGEPSRDVNYRSVDLETYIKSTEEIGIRAPVQDHEQAVEIDSNGNVSLSDTGFDVPPEPAEAMREIIAYYASLNQDADDPTKAGRIQLNKFLSAYPGAQGPLQSGEYDELMGSGGYFEIAVEDSDLPDFDSAMRTDLEEILRGETSHL